jgi:RimJ/RimL family protein N-acetyltransferase
MSPQPTRCMVPAPGMALEPLTADHASELFPVVADPSLYEYLDYGPPASAEALAALYRKLQAGRSPDGSEIWLNWAIRIASGQAIGYVQATVLESRSAWVAYVLGRDWWGQGRARSAMNSVLQHLAAEYGCMHFLASIEAANRRSIALVRALGFQPAAQGHSALAGLTATERLFVLERQAPTDVT